MGLYYSSLGSHEIPTTTSVNALGQKVVSRGGWYNSNGTPVNMVPVGGVGSGIYRTSTGSENWKSIPSFSVADIAPAEPKLTNADQATNSYQSAIDTLLGGVDSAKSAASRMQARITNATGDLDAARGAASGLGDLAAYVQKSALDLSPYARSIGSHGDALSQIAESLFGGNVSAGGAVGDYLTSTRDAADALAALSPERYVSRAASDAQAAIDNSRGQTERFLARRGVNIGSGANAGLMNQLQSLKEAALLAATKTNAWSKGETERADALTKRAGLYKDVLSTGMEASKQGVEDYATAAGIVQKQGDIFSTAAGIMKSQSDAYVNIGGVEVNLGSLDLSSEKVIQDSIASAASAQQAMAKFYQDTMEETTKRSGTDNYYTVTKSYS